MRENPALQEKLNIPKRGLDSDHEGKDRVKKILVIDDEPLLIDLMVHLLSLLGYRVDSALDHQEAAGKLKDQSYDLIFLDVKMPMMDGKSFYLKMNEHFPALAKRIVFLTGDVGNEETFNFILETENAYLCKPFTLKEIKNLLSRFFQESKRQ
ncbi:MAG TPA: response regulator [Candidatus Manganitrophaceae bacterium]|nr:response regulator [Candidatus Manganitrophaceae bacterium]